MKRISQNYNYGQRGFTIVEMLVTVVIVGLLTAVIVPNFKKYQGE